MKTLMMNWVMNLKTSDKKFEFNSIQGDLISKKETGLAKFVKLVKGQGFMTFKVEPLGQYAQLCANGFVVLVQKNIKIKKGCILGKLHICLAIWEILEKSLIYKVGFNI